MDANNSVNESQVSNSLSNRSGPPFLSVSVLENQIGEAIDLSKHRGVEESKIVEQGFAFMMKLFKLKATGITEPPTKPTITPPSVGNPTQLAILTNATPSIPSLPSSDNSSQSSSLANPAPSTSSGTSSGRPSQSKRLSKSTPILSSTFLSVSVLENQIKEAIDLSKHRGVEESKIVEQGFAFMMKLFKLKACCIMEPATNPTVTPPSVDNPTQLAILTNPLPSISSVPSSDTITQTTRIINPIPILSGGSFGIQRIDPASASASKRFRTSSQVETQEKVTKWIQSLPCCETINH